VSQQTTGERGALRFVAACYAGGLQKAFNPGSGGRTYWLLLLKLDHVPLLGWALASSLRDFCFDLASFLRMALGLVCSLLLDKRPETRCVAGG
jgi:hypothetical protein